MGQTGLLPFIVRLHFYARYDPCNTPLPPEPAQGIRVNGFYKKKEKGLQTLFIEERFPWVALRKN